MNVQLVSDFHDLRFDVWFDRDGLVFERLATAGMDRLEMLQWLKANGWRPPQFVSSDVWAARSEFPANAQVVAYTDLRSHQGEGKELCRFQDVVDGKVKTSLVADRVEGGGGSGSRSLRILRAGNYWAKLIYQSDDTWRSNVGHVDILAIDGGMVVDAGGFHSEGFNNSLLWIGKGRLPTEPYFPMWAIDLVWDDRAELRAVDLNIAPGIPWDELERVGWKPKDVAESVKRDVVERSRGAAPVMETKVVLTGLKRGEF